MVDRYEALERLSKLKADGVLTEDEFAAEKAKLLNRAEEATGAPRTSSGTEVPGRKQRALWTVPLALIALAVLIGISVGQNATTSTNGTTATAAAADTRIPACDSSEARSLIENVIEQSPLSKIANLRLLDTSNIVERSYDAAKPSRVCAADLTLNTGEEHKGYEMHLTSDGGSYLIQLMDDPGPAASPSPAASETPTALPATVPAESNSSVPSDPTSVVNDRWLIGRWMIKDPRFVKCDAEDATNHVEYGADHSFNAYESGGTWQLSGTTLQTSGEAEGDSFSDTEVITAATGDSFSSRDGDGKTLQYVRCPR